MEDGRAGGRKQPVTTGLDDEDFAELEQLARQRRSSISQVAREFIVAGIERERRLQALDRVAV